MIPIICIRHKGSFKNTEKFLKKASKGINLSILDRYAKEGVAALASVTPKDSGETSSSWYYKITKEGSMVKMGFYNSNVIDGVPIAIVLQYGHATRNGSWIEGRDYINPVVQPIFDNIANKAWKEVTK